METEKYITEIKREMQERGCERSLTENLTLRLKGEKNNRLRSNCNSQK